MMRIQTERRNAQELVPKQIKPASVRQPSVEQVEQAHWSYRQPRSDIALKA